MHSSPTGFSTSGFFLSGLGFVLLLVMIPYVILGQDAYVRILDNLDSEFVYFCLLKKHHLLFSLSGHEKIPEIMTGLPRFCLRSGINQMGVLFYFFSPFTAYVINMILVRVIGYTGMYFLAKDYLLKQKPFYIVPLSCVFALISIYPIYGISVLGVPLILWAMLNIHNRINQKISWLVVILYPFFSYMILAGPFTIACLGAIGIYFYCTEKKINSRYWLAIVLLGVLYLLAEFTLVKNLFGNAEFVSHRNDWKLAAPAFGSAIKTILIVGGKLYLESSLFYTPLILALGVATWFTYRNDKLNRRILFLLLASFALLVAFIAFYPFIQYAFENKIAILKTINLRRFSILLPGILFCVFAIALNKLKFSRTIGMLFVALQMLFVVYCNDELYSNLRRAYAPWTTNSNLNFAQFFASPLFDEVKKEIGEGDMNKPVVCLGMHPSIAQYNGFATLDSYQNNYPLGYKKEFRRIIAPELAKDEELRKYFDDWGSRCLVFSHELGKKYLAATDLHDVHPVYDLSLDTAAMKEMDCGYILSAVEITNASSLNMVLAKHFENDAWQRHIWLYKLL